VSRKGAVAVALVVAVAGAVVWAFRTGGGGDPDPFNRCVALAVQKDSTREKKADIEVSQAILRLFTGTTGGGDGAALKLSVSGADRVAFRQLTESESAHLIDTCAVEHKRTLGPINAEVQVWTKVEGQNVGEVKVVRVRRAGDRCVTEGGTCLLLLHDVKPGQPESISVNYGDLSATHEVSIAALADGVVTIELATGGRSSRAVLVTHKQELLRGVDVSVDEQGAGFAIRSASCARAGRVGHECASEGTGSEGRSAVFSMPDDRRELGVMIVRNGEVRRCRAVAQGTDFRADWDTCGTPRETPPPAPPHRCPDATLAAIRAHLSQEPRRSQMQQAAITLRFEIAGGVMSKVNAAPPGDLATLAGDVLRGQRFDLAPLPPTAACAGELPWQSH